MVTKPMWTGAACPWATTAKPGLLVKNSLIEPLLLFLQLLHHVVVDKLLFLVKDLQAVLEGHLPLQRVVLSKELLIG